MAIQYIQPGEPNQNAYIERFNRTYSEDVLAQYLFARLEDVREATWQFLIDYNERRPYNAPGGATPDEAPQSPESLLLKCLLDGGTLWGLLARV